MSVLRNSIQLIIKHLVYWALFITIILLGLVATLYWVSGAIEQRKDEIALWIGDEIGYPVTIEHTELNWVGIEPKLQVKSLIILQSKNGIELFGLEQIDFGLDIIDSIKKREPILNDISLIGMNIKVERDAFGAIHVQGFDKLKSSAVEEEDTDWFNLLTSFDLQSITVDYLDQKTTSLSGKYKIQNASLNYDGQDWSSIVILHPPVDFGGDIEFKAQGKALSNDDFIKNIWQWEIKASQLQLARVSTLLAWQGVTLNKAVINTTLSGYGIGMKIESIDAQVSVTNAEIVSLQTDSAPPVLINGLVGSFDWRRNKQSWKLASKQLQVMINGEKWPLTDFSVEKQQNAWSINASYLPLSDLTALALLSLNSPEQIRQQKPAGDIKNLKVHYSSQFGIDSFTFNLVEGALLPWNELPGVSGLTADVSWVNSKAKLNLNSHNITIYPEAWLKKGVFFDSITGQIDFWQSNDKIWQVQSQEFNIWNDDLILQLVGSVKKKANGKIINDLTLTLEEIKVNQWQKYIPQKGFDPLFKEWVTQAFPAGKIIEGTIRWQGDIAEFPYKKESEKGLFDLALQVEGVQLHYAAGWPDLMGVDAEITGDGNNLFIKSKHGTEAGFDFDYVTTTISKLAEKGPQLVAEAYLKGTTENALQFLLNSPLKSKFGKAVSTLEATGESQVRFTLNVPLADVESTQVNGNVSFVDSALYEKASTHKIGVTKINGLLQFSTSDVRAEGIKARILNQDIEVNIKPTKKNTIVSVSGKIATRDINAIWPGKLPTFISGETDYNVNVTVVEKSYGDFYVDAELSSNLKGLQIELPEPIKKDKETSQAFTASFKHIDDSLAYVIKYGEQFNAIIMDNTDLWRGKLRFVAGQARLPKLGVRVRGQLDKLALDNWLIWSDKQEGTDGGLLSSLDDIAIEIGQLTVFNQQLSNLNLSAQKGEQGWMAKILSDQSKGTIYISDDFDNGGRVKVNLNKLTLAFPKNNSTGEQVKETSATNLWPAMDISIDSLTINDMDLGKLNVKSHRNSQSWLLDSASLESDVFTASLAKGEWQQSISKSDNRSQVYLEVESQNVSALLANFDYQQAFDAKSIKLALDLSWLDTPLELSRKNADGVLTIDVRKGNLKKVKPGAAGRVFGLLSVAAIPQRLSLDFSGLFGKGFSFDSVSGSFNLENGLATTENLTLKGPPATIKMTGPIDLVNHSYNQKVNIRPNVASTLPIAGAVVIGPVGLAAGAAILLFDKVAGSILGKEIVNIISYNYDLTGPWDEPKMNVSAP